MLFALAAFVSSALLFVIQPMIGKMLLPSVGGAPAVWTTCLLFFQVGLLAGYAYAHALATRLAPRTQAIVQIVVLALPMLVLPLAVRSAAPAPGEDPTAWVVAALATSIGLPFFVLATSAPLLQRWYAGATGATDPYVLYAASNLGGLASLLAYPTLVEPNVGLAAQGRAFGFAYALFAVLVAACALSRFRAKRSDRRGATRSPAATARQCARWIALAFVPSSLMIGATTHIGSDIAAVPLLWIPPLALYLVSFVVAFTKRRGPPPELGPKTTGPFLALLVVLFLFSLPRVSQSLGLAALHLALVLFAGIVFHGELARRRPVAGNLTAFYLCVAAGGALGGVLGAVVAPLVFRHVVEYPLTMAVAVLLLPRRPPPQTDREREAAFLRSLGIASGEISHAPAPRLSWLDVLAPLAVLLVAVAMIVARTPALVKYGAPLVVCVFLSLQSRARLGLGLLAIAAASFFDRGGLHQERTFFGVLRVDERGGYRTLVHGTTIHGQEATDPAQAGAPLAYYAREGPIGQVFEALRAPLAGARVAVVGLGAGTLAAYAEPGQSFIFYEIDRAVERIATRYFGYLARCEDRCRVVLGDARLTLADAPAGGYGLIVLDAFSSDAIPTHLLTREALALYLAKLDPAGVLAFHVTNRYLSLGPVLAELARDAGLQGRIQRGAGDASAGSAPSTWVVLARRRDDLEAIASDARWEPLSSAPGTALWTDDFSNVLGAIRF